jgi:spectinomycin phosphotransferase
MVELFRLDWRLSEIAGFARRTGTDDDHIAPQGLHAERAGDAG